MEFHESRKTEGASSLSEVITFIFSTSNLWVLFVCLLFRKAQNISGSINYQCWNWGSLVGVCAGIICAHCAPSGHILSSVGGGAAIVMQGPAQPCPALPSTGASIYQVKCGLMWPVTRELGRGHNCRLLCCRKTHTIPQHQAFSKKFNVSNTRALSLPPCPSQLGASGNDILGNCVDKGA